MGHASYATSPKKAIREIVDNDMQKVGMREANEKKTYESYTSRERRYNKQQYKHSVKRQGQMSTYNECFQINPTITE